MTASYAGVDEPKLFGKPVSATTSDVTQMTRVWCAVVGVHVSAKGESITVSVKCLPLQD